MNAGQEQPLSNAAFEKSILSSIIYDFEAISAANPSLTTLTEEDFFYPPYRNIFCAIKELVAGDLPIDEEFIKKRLLRKKLFDEDALLDVISANPIANAAAYVKELKSMRIGRGLSSMLRAEMMSLSDGAPADEVLSSIERKAERLRQDGGVDDDIVMGDVLHEMHKDDTTVRRQTNIPAFDQRLGGGFDEGSFVIMTGEPEVGKTHISYSMIERASMDMMTGLVSLEFSKQDWIDRTRGLKCNGIEMNVANIATNFNSFDLSSLVGTLYRFASLGVKMTVVDSLMKIFNNGNFNSDTERVNDIGKTLDMVAKKTGMVIILLAQGSKEDNIANRMGVLNSQILPHLPKVFLRIVNENTIDGKRTVYWHKNKQAREAGKQTIYFNKDGSFSSGPVSKPVSAKRL